MLRILLLLLLQRLTADAYLIRGRMGHPSPKFDKNSFAHCHNTYQVQPGDTCQDIVTNFAMSVAVFNKLNPNITCSDTSTTSSSEALKAQTLVCVTGVDNNAMSDPLSDNASANSTLTMLPQEDSYGFTCTSSYTFKTNSESCMAVANLFGLDARALKTLNPDLPCDSSAADLNGKQLCLGGMNATTGGLMVGNVLMNASASAGVNAGNKCTNGEAFLIQVDTTCLEIADKTGVSLTVIAAANPDLDCRELVVSQVLCLKAPSTASTKSGVASGAKATTSVSVGTKSVPTESAQEPVQQSTTPPQADTASIQNDTPPTQNEDLASDCLSQLNHARAQYTGAAPLSWDPSLAAACQPVSDFCGVSQQLVHFDVGGIVAGQILASGGSCAGAYQAWVTDEYPSGGHYMIITNTDFSRIGCSTGGAGACICCDFA
ncbi:hypothetical protein CcCBS67573_g04521 [Chytriomyces confervae]|uniref:LysM domain-containing protein n=1 Tax=Chytriomyces confervae TaxID=246404 RepID=A0A507FFX0_9FUNG|nr:hypothetical protein CcCBS67573_g04521 [Chytriomyces confervae]